LSSPKYPKEAALIKEVQTGQRDAIGKLYAYLHKKTFASVRKLVKNQRGTVQDAEDLFQEAFLTFRRKIMDGSYSYNPNAALGTYFFELYKYRWRDELKSARRRTESDAEPADRPLTDQNAEENLIRTERERQLQAQIERLGKQCAELLRLFIWKEWTLESIAEEMGITPQSAKNQKYRCMKRLKENYLRAVS
jgi:RNA polymerase sigma factor (sigma-70 family)